MDTRVNIFKTEPEAIKALSGLENYLKTSALTNIHQELIKLRASQINGCAFCIDMHTRDARKFGETEQRMHLLNAWRETTLYTEEERVILAMTEEITKISNHGLSDETYAKAASLFDQHYLSQVIMAIIMINAWNRLAISTHMQPALEKA